MKSSILIIFIAGIFLKFSDSKLSNFEQCVPKVTPVDLTKEKGQWYQVLRSKTYDAGKCYFWDIIVNGAQVSINQTARYMDTPTTQTFNLNVIKGNGTYQTTFQNQQPNMQVFFKVGTFLVSYLCDKKSAIMVLPGVYSKAKTALTKAEIDQLTVELKKNSIDYKDGTTKNNVAKCKYTTK